VNYRGRTSRLRNPPSNHSDSCRAPETPLVEASGTVVDPAGTVATPAGTSPGAGGFDAALVRITP
jgi:hypothetical protein